jgi:hypothetical protein
VDSVELAFLPEEAEYTDSTERVLVASVISVTQNQLFLWILPTYPVTSAASLNSGTKRAIKNLNISNQSSCQAVQLFTP